MKKLHYSTTASRLRNIIKREDFNTNVRISKMTDGYCVDISGEEWSSIRTNGNGFLSYIEYHTTNEKGYIMNPDNIAAKKFVAAVWHMLNEKREINMFEKSFLDEMRRFYRDFSRGYAKYWETPLDILNA